MTKRFKNAVAASLLAAVVVVATDAVAQPYMHGPEMMGPGMMSPGMMGWLGDSQTCGLGRGGMMFSANDRLVEALKLTDAQKSKYEDFRTASRSAFDAMQNSCDTKFEATVPGRMEAMEGRMAAMLAALRMLRPALDAFYASLTETQKLQFDSGSRRPSRWHWRGAW